MRNSPVILRSIIFCIVACFFALSGSRSAPAQTSSSSSSSSNSSSSASISPSLSPSPSPTPAATPVIPEEPVTTIGNLSWSVQNSVVHYGSRAVFPLGLYYVSYYDSEELKRFEDVETIAAAGFNLIHTPIDRNDRGFLDRCADLGINVVLEFNDSPTYLLEEFGSHPALAFIGAFDDVDAYLDGRPNYPSDQVALECSRYKDQVPRLITYISGGYPQRLPDYAGTSEAMGFQVYPIPAETLAATTSGYFGPMESIMSEHNQAFIANLQSFAWSGGYRWPTNREVRNMTYQALIAGVKGILYYAFYDGETDLNNHPSLWNELSTIADEIRVIEPFLLHGDRTRLNTGNAEVFSAVWSLESSSIVVIANASQDRSLFAIINLSGNTGNTARNIFPDRESSLTLDSNWLFGSLSPEDVQVYLIER
jgi:hypothetical protein